MAAIKDSVFGPMMPKIDSELLPDKLAQFAQNLNHTSGSLKAWRLPAAVPGVTMPGVTPIRTIYRYGKDTASKVNYWFQFPGDVNIIKGPVAKDTEERTYWTDGAYPKKTRSSLAGLVAGTAILPASLRLGVPPPGWTGPSVPLSFTPAATVSGTATDPASTPLTSTYVVTYVTTWNEESSPSNPSNIVIWRQGQTVTLTLPGAIGGAYAIDRVRIYRSNTGTARTTFQRVNDRPVATTTHADTALATALGETCPTFDWNPPSDGLIGLTSMGNGMLAGFEGSTVSFCEPNYPYAWPAKYDLPQSAPIVGLAHFGQTLVVTTTDGLVLLEGIDPGSMSQTTPKGAQAGTSKRSMVEMMGGVVYASPDGLEFIGAGGSRNLTESILSRDDWQAYAPASIDGYSIDGRYYAFYDTGSVQACLIFSFGVDPGFVKCDQTVTAGYTEDRTDSLFVVSRVGTANTLVEWNTGSSMLATWRGRENRFHSGVCMSRAMVLAAGYPVTYRLYADGALKYTFVVPDSLPFPLPDGRNRTISHEVSSTSKVLSVRTATSVKELGDGGV